MKKIRQYIESKIGNAKESIRIKLFLIMTVTIVLIILALILINTFIIESYYMYYKKESLLSAYDKINKYITNNNLSHSDVEIELEKIAINNNFNIVIMDKNNISIYNSNKDFKYYMLNIENINKKNIIYSNENTYIIELKETKSGINFVMLIGKLENNNMVYIRMPISSIKDSVKISNNFLYSIGAITIIISGIAILIISKRFTNPILELNNIANKMSNLDFSQKYRIKDTNDEIENLGKNINKMSDKLEETITKLQKNNNELERNIEEKSKIDEMRKQFISDVSHELKTPISLIQGYAEGLIENVNTDDENRRFYAEVILDEANKMDKMVKELLELMKLEYGAKKPNNINFNVVELINEEVRKYTVLLNENNIKVKFDVIEPIYVYSDYNLTEQILNNYLSNAIKNIEEIEKEKYIEITLKLIDKKIRISVFNTGKNISQENMQKIWNRFYKEDTSRNRQMGGTGIGLSLVKAIMNNYNNEYGVINKKKGVEFYFDLCLIKGEIKENE